MYCVKTAIGAAGELLVTVHIKIMEVGVMKICKFLGGGGLNAILNISADRPIE